MVHHYVNHKHTGKRSNPYRRKEVGHTVGILACAAAGVVEWPVDAMVYIFRRMKGRRIMSHPGFGERAARQRKGATKRPRHEPMLC
ncbi:hypothetical protein MA16_Dca024600 [Dendrobium catenatum]|uniref:Uncharacterized protein n=1 Tax=Dendrobium catenatum TaxID=906689 RepID=A0A2I0X0M6_9ASPA|nr:hypothetical protein MA16_Dca024600 [Dendrobium catenatum]